MADQASIAKAIQLVAPAEAAFRSRWRLSSLKRVDSDLHDAVSEQVELYHAATVMGAPGELRAQSEAMVRGWAAACRAMEAAQHPDDAYLMGMDDESGIQVVISEHKGSRDELAKRYGEPLVIMTPNEVATLLATFELIKQAKQHFPDAEIIGGSK